MARQRRGQRVCSANSKRTKSRFASEVGHGVPADDRAVVMAPTKGARPDCRETAPKEHEGETIVTPAIPNTEAGDKSSPPFEP